MKCDSCWFKGLTQHPKAASSGPHCMPVVGPHRCCTASLHRVGIGAPEDASGGGRWTLKDQRVEPCSGAVSVARLPVSSREVPWLCGISRVVPCRHGPWTGWLHVRMYAVGCTTTWKHQSQIQRQTNQVQQHTMTASNTGPSMPRAMLGDFLLEACQRRSSCDADLVAGGRRGWQLQMSLPAPQHSGPAAGEGNA